MPPAANKCVLCGKFIKPNLNFCSKSCAGKYGNLKKEAQQKNCSVCGKFFTSLAGNAKYCSDECASHNGTLNGYRSGTATKKKWKKLKRRVDRSECYNCGWDEATCDLAHVTARKNGGEAHPNNLTVLCPNCHRLADKTDKIDITSVPTVREIEGKVLAK